MTSGQFHHTQITRLYCVEHIEYYLISQICELLLTLFPILRLEVSVHGINTKLE